MFDMQDWDFERLASELLREIRGKRSQSAFARRLGYRSNAVHCWEAGTAFPTAARALEAAQRSGIDVRQALLTLYRKPPGWLGELDATTPEGAAQFLRDLRGRTSLKELAFSSGRNRFAIARWLKGQAEPRLPDFLMMIEATTFRLLDFLAALVNPEHLPSVRDAWRELELARQATYQNPWSQAVLRLLETHDYHQLAVHTPGWLAQRLKISFEQERRALEVLVATQQIEWCEPKFRIAAEPRLVDTRRDPNAAWQLRTFWSQVANQRLQERAEGLFSHNVFGVSERDLGRIRELQKAYFSEVRAIVAQSHPVERVALLNVQLLPLA